MSGSLFDAEHERHDRVGDIGIEVARSSELAAKDVGLSDRVEILDNS